MAAHDHNSHMFFGTGAFDQYTPLFAKRVYVQLHMTEEKEKMDIEAAW